MQFSYQWLQDYFSDTLPSPAELGEQVGMHMFELEGLEELSSGDTLIDWDILPNRSSDCLCYDGLVREIRAITGLSLKEGALEYSYQAQGGFETSELLDFSLETDLVDRATKNVVTNVQVGPSPEWLRTRLESIGQKSINNVVDITNYVMFTTGQPVHAFDYDKLEERNGKKIMSIRPARKGETLVDLTGAEHTLDESMLVVASGEQALDVAGIKGGIDSGVTEETKRIVISACDYNFSNIRATSRALKLRTDASARYENEVPLVKAARAQARAAELVEQECAAQASSSYIDTHPSLAQAQTIPVSTHDTSDKLGVSVSQEDITRICTSLDCEVQILDEDGLEVTPPLDRPDLTITEDIIEEVGRLYGYAHIEPRAIHDGFNMPQPEPIFEAQHQVAHTLVALGFYEILSRSLVDSGAVALSNPLTSDAGYLRTNLLELVQRKVESNFDHTAEPRMFEIGKVFTGTSENLVEEHWSFAGVIGKRKIKEKHKREIFLQTKGVIETVCDTLGVQGIEWKEGAGDTLAILEISGDVLGAVGVNWWELNFEELVAHIDTRVEYSKPSKYPTIDRDLAVWVPLNIRVRDLEELIAQAELSKCISTELFDVYEDTANSRKSLGFRMVFQCHEETLTDEFVNAQMEKVYKLLEAQEQFEIR